MSGNTTVDIAREQLIDQLAAAIDIKDSGSILRFGTAAQTRAQAAAGRHAGRRPQPGHRRRRAVALRDADGAQGLRRDAAGGEAELLPAHLHQGRRRGHRDHPEIRGRARPGGGDRRQAGHPPHQADGGRGAAGATLHRHARLVPCAGRPHRRRRARPGPTDAEHIPAMVAAAERGDSPIAAQNLRDRPRGARRAGPPRARPAPDPAGGYAGACPRCG
jgi:hypothetical protein